MVSVAVPLALLTTVNAAVWIVPGARAGPRTPVRPSASAVPAATPATDRPATAASRCRRRARPLAMIASTSGGLATGIPDRE
jgi:hypothetical protein